MCTKSVESKQFTGICLYNMKRQSHSKRERIVNQIMCATAVKPNTYHTI